MRLKVLAGCFGDPQQMTHVRQLAGFFGLAPTERSTGDRVARGHITRSGDGRLRSKLIQAVQFFFQ